MLGLSDSNPIFKKVYQILFKRNSNLILTQKCQKSNFYGNYIAKASNESKMCSEETKTHCNGQASIFYLYTELTKFGARSIIFKSVAREVAKQPFGGLF